MSTNNDSERKTLTGRVDAVTFHNPENGYCVLRVTVNNQREPSTLIGSSPAVVPGQNFVADGQWVYNDRYKKNQFHAETLQLFLPDSEEALVRYLSSGLVDGIGTETAKRIVKCFGKETIRILDSNPSALEGLKGIGVARRQRIQKAWSRHREIDNITRLLRTYGVGTEFAARISRHYGSEAANVIQRNPYQLAEDITGIGFVRADAIAKQAGIRDDSAQRIQGGLRHVLTSLSQRGHVGYPYDDLLKESAELLKIDAAQVRHVLDESIARDTFASEKFEQDIVYLPHLLTAERETVQQLKRLMQQRTPWPPVDSAMALEWVERRLGVALSNSQREAVKLVLSNKVSVLTGGPGHGQDHPDPRYFDDPWPCEGAAPSVRADRTCGAAAC